MAHIELARALEDYFAFAETTPTRKGRRFTISLPYFDGDRLDRLQWWYHVSPEQERQTGDAALTTAKTQATSRFRLHIERWLENTRQQLGGDGPIPRIGAAAALETPAVPVDASAADESAGPQAAEVPWPTDKVANG